MGVLIKRRITTAPIQQPVQSGISDIELAKQRAKEVAKQEAGAPKSTLSGESSTLHPNWRVGCRQLYEKYYKNPNKKKEQDMAVKVKVGVIKKAVVAQKEVVKKAKGKTIEDLWVEVLSRAVGKRLTDKALAVQMSNEATKLSGKKRTYDEASVAGHRSGYNNGRFPIQKGVKPKVRLEKFEVTAK